MRSPLHLVALLLVTSLAYADPRAGFIANHCLDCHDSFDAKGGLDLESLSVDFNQPDTRNMWVTIHDRVASGEMPPKKKQSRLSVKDRNTFLAALRNDLLDAERKIEQTGGFAHVRRMNRTEYENSLRDLLHLPLLRVKELLPEDGQSHGFDKVPTALDISHVQMTKYLEAADVALRQAIVRSPKRPESTVWRESAVSQWSGRGAIAVHCAIPVNGRKPDPRLTSKIMGNPVTDIGNTYRAAIYKGDAESLVLLTGVIGAHQPQGIQPDRFRPTVGGWYKVRFSIWGGRWNRDHVEPAVRSVIRKHIEFGPPYKEHPVERFQYTPLEKPSVREVPENTEFYGDSEVVHVVRASLKGEVIGFYDAPSLKPTVHEFKVWLEPGEKISFHAMSLPGTGAMNSGSADGVRSYEGPCVAFDWFEIEGPMTEVWPPASQQRLFGTTPIGSFPKPLLPNMPTAKMDETATIGVDALSGTGQRLSDVWYLNIAGTVTSRLNFATAGDYDIRVIASETAAGNEASLMRVTLNGTPIPHGRFTVDAPRNQPKSYAKRVHIPCAGPAEIGIEFLNDYFDEATKADRNLLISRIEVIGVKPDTSSNAIEIPEPRTLLHSFATKAFRRSVDASEIEIYAAVVESELNKAASFEDAMIAGYKAILCSPDFLFLGLEGDSSLASRLAYFMWNSMPDDQLIRLAQSGDLQKRDTLIKQVDRLLADPRSDRFIEHFLDEWLELKKIDFTTPDPQLYPEFDPWLRDSMLTETHAYFRKLITDRLPIDNVVDSDFLLVNQRLAELYDIRGVYGAKFRKVPIPEGSPRGGLLTQASVLKVTANGTATSPVLRGVWICERILGIPTRPPPPNVPAVEPDASGAVTIRELIEQHRADAACASCHRVMDPPGLALENFDVIGGWRGRYRASGRPRMVGRGKDRKMEPFISVTSAKGRVMQIRLGGEVDASGELTDGRTFQNIDSFRKLILADRRTLAKNVARKLLIYATGKGYRFLDRDAIDAVVDTAGGSQYDIRSLINGVVTSDLFQR